MRYTLYNVEHKDYQGKKYVKALARDVSGVELEVSLGDKWGDRLATFKSTDVVEANPWQNPKNSKWSLYPIEDKKERSGVSGVGYKSAQIEKAVERKEQGIARSQDNKDFSIRVSSTMNKAVDLAIAEIKDISTLNTLESDILKWREWLWRNWEVSDTQYPPF